MHPILFQIPGLGTVYTYLLTSNLAMVAALFMVRSEAGRRGWNVRNASLYVVAGTLAGFGGAHVVFMLTRFDLPWSQWLWAFFDFTRGYVWFGGLLAAWYLGRVYARHQGIPGRQMDDVQSFGALIALAVGRLGCIAAGCCYGVPTTLPWGILLQTREYGYHRVHPVPLYESLFLMILFAFLWRYRRRNPPDGMITAIYVGVAALGRFLLEFLRGDTIRGFVATGFSTSQFIAIGVMAASVAYGMSSRIRASRSTPPR